ncbi:hypothetical protein [Jiella sonneratiae]|uniref:Phage holin family protein n=1 Tax=Jiella sonneratiae TaxID=2816856 RepID=A0ABS3J020_9HYPH|nr:hypothetical protein [Jiella sonneratiae]MBO0902485.1 hypothetical protein [Jiella sonneratiae]
MRINLIVEPVDKPMLRQRLRELARREKRRANSAGNAAQTAQQVGIGIGGALAAGGGVAMATVASPFVLGAAVVTATGAGILMLGLGISHWMNAKKFAHEEKVDRYQDAVEELQ